MERREFIKKIACGIAGICLFGKAAAQALADSPGRKIILGRSKINLPRGALVGAQVDRVIRDIAWKNSRFDQRKNPYAVSANKQELVPYMEGRLLGDMIEYAGIKVIGLTPCNASKKGGDYFATNSENEESYYIDPGKLLYPSATFSKNGNEAILVDTHGFNTVAAEAVRLDKISRLALVVACMDLESKAKAALYLANKGLNCYAPCDRHGSDLLGYSRQKADVGIIMGSAPIRRTLAGAVIGNQPIIISELENIVVQTTDKGYPDQYCDTPRRYFDKLAEVYGLDLRMSRISAAIGETDRLVAEAQKRKASLIAARVSNEADEKPLTEWLKKSKNNRLVLFHSAPYESGYGMFFKFPEQTSFGDLDPVII